MGCKLTRGKEPERRTPEHKVPEVRNNILSIGLDKGEVEYYSTIELE